MKHDKPRGFVGSIELPAGGAHCPFEPMAGCIGGQQDRAENTNAENDLDDRRYRQNHFGLSIVWLPAPTRFQAGGLPGMENSLSGSAASAVKPNLFQCDNAAEAFWLRSGR